MQRKVFLWWKEDDNGKWHAWTYVAIYICIQLKCSQHIYAAGYFTVWLDDRCISSVGKPLDTGGMQSHLYVWLCIILLENAVHQTPRIFNNICWSKRRTEPVHRSVEKAMDVSDLPWLYIHGQPTNNFGNLQYTVKTDVLWWHKNVLFLIKMDKKQHKMCYHSTSILTVYVSENWSKAVKWQVITVPHYNQKDNVSCGILTMQVWGFYHFVMSACSKYIRIRMLYSLLSQ